MRWCVQVAVGEVFDGGANRQAAETPDNPTYVPRYYDSYVHVHVVART